MTAAKATELLKVIDQQMGAFMQSTEAADRADELLDDPAQGEQLPGPLADLRRRKEQIKQMTQTCREMDAIRKKSGIDPEKNAATLAGIKIEPPRKRN